MQIRIIATLLCDAVIVKNDKTWSTKLKFQENITEKLHVVR